MRSCKKQILFKLRKIIGEYMLLANGYFNDTLFMEQKRLFIENNEFTVVDS